MKFKILLLINFAVSVSSFADIRLPKLISNGMVLQRDAVVKIWGWAENGEEIKMSFQEKTYITQTSDHGKWEIQISNLKVGGPYEIIFQGQNQLTIKNVLVGDVWVCSGQSNMELPMRRVRPLYEEEIASANNTFIRLFSVPQNYNFKTPQEDLPYGEWKQVNTSNILDFSANAYFFAKNIYEKIHLPIGLINSSLGGSPAEAWMSEEALKQFPQHYNEALRFKNDTLIHEIENSDKTRSNAWYTKAALEDAGYKDIHWAKDTTHSGPWSTINIPGLWSGTELNDFDGVVWFKKEFIVDGSFDNRKAKLNLGAIVDADSVWINGKFIGTTSYLYPPRWYEIPDNVLHKGKNTITIRLINEIGNGGFVEDKIYGITVGDNQINLAGLWKYKIGVIMPKLESQTFVRWKPLGIYNAMLSPLLNYSIKGIIWYQGESNVSRAGEYRELFSAMIHNWRKEWGLGDIPFIYVQLANFMKPTTVPGESDWAMLRDAQRKCLELPRTAMAVSIDIGEWNDIHPLNKADIGKRLALGALHVVYGYKNLVYSGPSYEHMQVKNDTLLLSFKHVGGGMLARNGRLKGFAIAGPDKKFVWADAKIVKNKIIVYQREIKNPVAVRYAWADNPQDANLINKEGLPASPFRTDDW